MNRLTFLRRASIALAGGLILGPEALEQFAKLTHVRKSFPSAAIMARIPVSVWGPSYRGGAVILEGGYECYVVTPSAETSWLTVPHSDPLAVAYRRDGYVDIDASDARLTFTGALS